MVMRGGKLDENKKNYNIYLDEINKKNKEIKESEKEYLNLTIRRKENNK